MTSRTNLAESCPPGATHCITCSDEAVPMRVLSVPDAEGRDAASAVALCAAADGRIREVLVGLVDQASPGDRLLVHAGAALRRLPEEPAP